MEKTTSDATQGVPWTTQTTPFDQDKLGWLLDQAGVDTVLASSNHKLEGCPDRDGMSFLPHGTGMVISVETHVADPEIGFVKLEDTIFVTPQGWEAAADFGRR